MQIGIKDASSYFKGLLLLIRKDHRVTEQENSLLMRIGKSLGFEKEFCESAIKEILRNKYIEDAPPEFSSQEVAVMFIRDGLALAFCDGRIDRKEEKWIRAVAARNRIDQEWITAEIEKAGANSSFPDKLEADKMSIVHSS